VHIYAFSHSILEDIVWQRQLWSTLVSVFQQHFAFFKTGFFLNIVMICM